MKGVCTLSLALLCASPALAEMRPMSDGDMQRVSGQEGIALELEFTVNADSDGNPLGAAQDRRLALSFSNRPGEWLVMKDFYGTIKIPTLNLDANTNPAGPTPYEDLGRFVDINGNGVSPHGLFRLDLTAPEPLEFHNVTIGGMAVEYGTTGYSNASTATFVGFEMGNSGGATLPAELTIDGTVALFGF